MRADLLALAALAAACGDNGGHGTDGAPGDALAPADSVACAPDQALATWRDLGTVLQPVFVTLDGVGSRCEQVERALPQLIALDPSMANLLATPHMVLCGDGVPESIVLTFYAPVEVDGLATFSPFGWDWTASFWVLTPSGETYYNGSFLDVPSYPGPSCLSAAELRLRMMGQPVLYREYLSCDTVQASWYTTAIGDAFLVDDAPELYFVDFTTSSLEVHRARWVDVVLLPSHVTPSLLRSNFNCCDGPSLVDCVGTRALVDVFTAEVLYQEPRCATTCDLE